MSEIFGTTVRHFQFRANLRNLSSRFSYKLGRALWVFLLEAFRISHNPPTPFGFLTSIDEQKLWPHERKGTVDDVLRPHRFRANHPFLSIPCLCIPGPDLQVCPWEAFRISYNSPIPFGFLTSIDEQKLWLHGKIGIV